MTRKEQLDLAKIGMLALVDEATRYQEDRPKDELRKKYQELKEKDSDAASSL